jgi:hypothetical protein
MIESFDILFRVLIRHNYFNDGLCPSFNIIPDSHTAERFRKYGFIFRETKAGFTVLVKSEKRTNDLFPAVTVDMSLQFNFLLKLKNPGLLNVTTLTEPVHGSFHLFSNSQVSVDSLKPDTIYFDQGNYVRPASDDPEFRENHSISGLEPGVYSYQTDKGQQNYYLAPHSMSLSPFALISIDIGHNDIITADGKLLQPWYTLQLNTKSTYWQYILNVNQGRENLVIESSGSPIEFDKKEEMISSNKPVLIFTSKEEIPITESRDDYFRLKIRNGDPSNDLILISKLPLPEIEIFSRMNNGKTYTPIYVNF